jgi:hypothetical protein
VQLVQTGLPLSRRKIRALAVFVVVLLAAGAAGWYQVAVRSTRPPNFAQGGRFAQAASSTAAQPLTANVGAAGSVQPDAAPAPSTPANSYAPGRITAVAGAPAPATPTAGSGASPAASVVPAAGTYTWRVDGTEGATGFGSRPLPSSMTVVAHGDKGIAPGQIVLDTTYSSDHQERLIVGEQSGALVSVFEGGQVRFGPMAQTNSGRYAPPIVLVPADLHDGAVTKGTTNVKDGSGKVERIEDWTLSVVHRTTIPVAGVPTSVWELVLERNTRPGSDQQVHRVIREWWDPNRRSLVRYHDTMHGEQHYAGVAFTYDSDITADFVKYTP